MREDLFGIYIVDGVDGNRPGEVEDVNRDSLACHHSPITERFELTCANFLYEILRRRIQCS